MGHFHRAPLLLLTGLLAVGLALPVWSRPRQDRAPASSPRLASEVDEALRAGTEWLLQNQLEHGGWGSHHSPRPIEVLASVPGSQDAFRVGTTGLVLCALMDSPYGGDAKERALERGFEHLLIHHAVKRQSGLEHYNVWAFGFALQAFGERLLQRPDDPRAEAMRAASSRLVEKLAGYQSVDGGWGYLSIQGYETHPPAATSMSFTTSTILVGLARAQAVGIPIPQALLDRALDSVQRCRLPDGPYTYGELWNRMPVAPINRPAGAACRTPACQYALGLFDRPEAEADRRRALLDLLVRHALFQQAGVRRPMPHESWYQISGYFYLYGHAYAGYLLEGLPPESRRRSGELLARAVLHCAQPDGSFWDYPLYSYHKPYGTAFALIALSRVLPRTPASAEVGSG